MRFAPIGVAGAYRVLLDVHGDARGGFARTFCIDTFAAAGIDFAPVQCNLSRNPTAGTLRGLHFQVPPHEEAKLVHCTRGGIFDAVVDLRRASPTYGAAAWAELTDANDTLLYVPPGCAHGFLTTAPDSEVCYYMGSRFVAGAGAGIRWDDPALGIPWPAAPTLVSERDATYPTLAEFGAGVPA